MVAIKSFRKRAYEKFAVWLNFFGALTICVYKVGEIFPWFKIMSDYGSPSFILVTELLVSLIAIAATMVFATFPVFVKHSENDLAY